MRHHSRPRHCEVGWPLRFLTTFYGLYGMALYGWPDRGDPDMWKTYLEQGTFSREMCSNHFASNHSHPPTTSKEYRNKAILYARTYHILENWRKMWRMVSIAILSFMLNKLNITACWQIPFNIRMTIMFGSEKLVIKLRSMIYWKYGINYQ